MTEHDDRPEERRDVLAVAFTREELLLLRDALRSHVTVQIAQIERDGANSLTGTRWKALDATRVLLGTLNEVLDVPPHSDPAALPPNR